MLQNLEKISPLSTEVLQFLTTLAGNEKVDKIIVFGSRALGDFEKYSDLDLAVDAAGIEKFEWLKLKEYVTYDLRDVIKVSLVHYSTNPIKLKERINQTGTIIYVKQSQTRRQLRKLKKGS
ncbi:nucleotidyltransferase family protein [Rufibacter latericius]|uniref:Nucleotidyltransferase domain-containing protein n=1 Tax=Rufibacter latericius TaxID=2487040 RepID=A0A3M9MAP8_9BACT|nr:nucleotidyltransferase domain-containing protein [Rufibacter latericius]